jgi:hypothetical protein
MRTGWLGMLAATALVTVACGSISATPPSASGPAIRNLAMVTLSGSNDIVVRDVTDMSHPKTIGTIGPIPELVGYAPSLEGAYGQFISAAEASYLRGQTGENFGLPTRLFRQPVSGSVGVSVVSSTQAIFVFAWSPDASTVTYVLATPAGTELHRMHAEVDRVVGPLPVLGVGGCEAAPCPPAFQDPADNWDFRLSYSPDGAFIAVVQNGITSFFRVWTSDGKLLSESDGGGTTMSVWSGSSLYFRDATGVEVWRDKVISSFLRGVEWIRPKASPDGRYIVYEARALGSAHVFIVDTTSGQIRDLGQGRSEPAFLTSRYVWYEAEPVCVPEGKCQASFPGVASGPTYVYDVQDGTETRSEITSVIDIWPHAG